MSNILILSSGTRVALVNYFKETIKGTIICADCSPIAPTLFAAHKHYVVKRMTEPSYLEQILDICKQESINAIFSLIDPELSLLAANRAMFENEGITVIVSDEEAVEISFDKMRTANHLKTHGFPYIKSYLSLADFQAAHTAGEVDFPLFVKPRQGSCSYGIQKIETWEQLETCDLTDAIIQQFMPGKEYGIDVYVDMISGEVTNVFIKEKLLMRAGETDKSISVVNPSLTEQVVRFVNTLKFKGPIDIDVFELDGVFYISEINPRFGGGYLHAYQCNQNYAACIERNLQGQANPSQLNQYPADKIMMKYLDVTMIDA